MTRKTSSGTVLKLVAPASSAQQDAPPPAAPKTHPAGVWDLPAANGYRRLVAIFPDGNVAMELNMSDQVPEPIRVELKAGLERSLELSLRALKIVIAFAAMSIMHAVTTTSVMAPSWYLFRQLF